MTITIKVGSLKTVGTNGRENWRPKAARIAKERAAVAEALTLAAPSDAALSFASGAVLLTRHSAGVLDDDNLRGALKGTRDEAAAWLGIDDKDPRIAWDYSQEKCKAKMHSVSITFGHVTEFAKARALLLRWVTPWIGTIEADTKPLVTETRQLLGLK